MVRQMMPIVAAGVKWANAFKIESWGLVWRCPQAQHGASAGMGMALPSAAQSVCRKARHKGLPSNSVVLTNIISGYCVTISLKDQILHLNMR